MESMSPRNHSGPGKRARSPSDDPAGPPSKSAKTQANPPQINYLARQSATNIQLLNTDDTLPAILRIIGDYDGVFQRHESLAGNLGACPLGPILMKRFERLFEGPPRILKSNGKDPHVSWLDVVDFARNKPEQFNLEKMRNNLRVCQFYTKQCRVEISEEDYVLINSGMPQKLIPPQPIQEDEEKELGALELVEKNLNQIVQMADQVSSRARQLNHRLKNRKAAIISRREAEDQKRGIRASESYTTVAELVNGNRPGSNGKTSQSPSLGFTAVNSKLSSRQNRLNDTSSKSPTTSSHALLSRANTDSLTILNGSYIRGVPEEERMELIKSFLANSDSQVQDDHSLRRPSLGTPGHSSTQDRSRKRSTSSGNGVGYVSATPTSAVPIPSTPASLLPHLKPTQAERDDGGPYKAAMVLQMEALARGGRIQPPCDRCRRLHMDCLKNLTACQGCTKKHAKCSWKDVREEELRALRAGRQPVSISPDPTLPPIEDMESPSNVDNLSSHQSPIIPAALQPLGQAMPMRKELDLLPPTESVASPAIPATTSIVLEMPRSLPSQPPLPLPPTQSVPAPSNLDASSRSPPKPNNPAAATERGIQNSDTATHDRAVLSPLRLPQSPQSFGGPAPSSVRPIPDDEEDEGDRLQVLAAQVYRTASAQQVAQQAQA